MAVVATCRMQPWGMDSHKTWHTNRQRTHGHLKLRLLIFEVSLQLVLASKPFNFKTRQRHPKRPNKTSIPWWAPKPYRKQSEWKLSDSAIKVDPLEAMASQWVLLGTTWYLRLFRPWYHHSCRLPPLEIKSKETRRMRYTKTMQNIHSQRSYLSFACDRNSDRCPCQRRHRCLVWCQYQLRSRSWHTMNYAWNKGWAEYTVLRRMPCVIRLRLNFDKLFPQNFWRNFGQMNSSIDWWNSNWLEPASKHKLYSTHNDQFTKTHPQTSKRRKARNAYK